MKIHLDTLPPCPPRGEWVGLDTEVFNMNQAHLHRPHGDLACLSVAVGDDVYVVTTPRDLAAALRRVDKCEWVMQKGEFDIRQWRRWTEVKPRRYWDTHYVEKALYSNYYDKFDLAALSRRWLRKPMDKEAREHFYGAGVMVGYSEEGVQERRDVPPRMTKEMVRYAARDAWTTLRVAEKQMALCNGPEDPDGGMSVAAMVEAVWYGTDLPALWAVLDMRGVCINEAEWAAIADEQQAILDNARAKLKYNPASNKDVAARLLAEGIKLPKTDAGNYSVREEVLEDYKGKSATVREVLEFRSAQKFAGTYGRKFLGLVEEDGRIHAEFSVYGAGTGRMSSDHPNLQNIPARDPTWGPRYRRAFVPERGNIFVKADYTQQELYILAQVSRDETMRETIRARSDLHTATAARIFQVPEEKVTKEQRAIAKGFNFGLAYGKTESTLAADLGITRAEAKEFMSAHFAAYPGVAAWKFEQEAKQDFVETVVGRRFWLNPYMGRHAQNNALNSPIQGGGADMFKRAIAKMHQRWPVEWGPFGLCLLVHDEVVVEAPRTTAQACKRLVRECALEAEAEMLPDVRPAAEVAACKNWYGDKP